jgi:hypothetical protein
MSLECFMRPSILTALNKWLDCCMKTLFLCVEVGEAMLYAV